MKIVLNEEGLLSIPPLRLALTTAENALKYRIGDISLYIRSLRNNQDINIWGCGTGADRIRSSDFPKEYFEKTGYPTHYQFIGFQEPFFIYDGFIYVSSMPELWPIQPDSSNLQDPLLMNREIIHVWMHLDEVSLVRIDALTDVEILSSGYQSRSDFEGLYQKIKFGTENTLQYENNPYVWILTLSPGPKYSFDGIQKYRINARKRHEQELYPERQYKITEPTNAIYPMPASKKQIEKYGDLAKA